MLDTTNRLFLDPIKKTESILYASDDVISEEERILLHKKLEELYCLSRKKLLESRLEHEDSELILEKDEKDFEKDVFAFIEYEDASHFSVLLPPLLPKKALKGTKKIFIQSVCQAMIEQFEKLYIPKKSSCTVQIVHHLHAERSMTDYDNVETSSLINVLADFILWDDNPSDYTLIHSSELIEKSQEEYCEIRIYPESEMILPD